VAKKRAGNGEKRRPDYGFCSVCQKTVLIVEATGRVLRPPSARRVEVPR
jgi:hypothetical protein